jgi:type I restriction enzyme M protein
MLPHVRDKVFPHFRRLAERTAGDGSQFAAFMKDAQLMIQKPSLLVKAVNAVQDLPLDRGDTKGDLYEYLLGKLTTAGINGQFRTPRHIIRMMVELMAPAFRPHLRPLLRHGGLPGRDLRLPAAPLQLGEAGTHRETVLNEKGEPEEQVIYSGDLLAEHRHHVDTDMFHAFDFDATMLRIATMNLVMHGVAEPDVHYQDTLSQSFDGAAWGSKERLRPGARQPAVQGQPGRARRGCRTCCARQDQEDRTAIHRPHPAHAQGSVVAAPPSCRMACSSVPARPMCNCASTWSRQPARSRDLLPSGVFKPYAGVSTAIIVFSKGGATEKVFFYDVTADGYSLDDKRQPMAENDLRMCSTSGAPGATARAISRTAPRRRSR